MSIMSDVLEQVRSHSSVLGYERDGVVVMLTLKSTESNHYVVRKIESADNLMLSSPLESDEPGEVKLKVIATGYR